MRISITEEDLMPTMGDCGDAGYDLRASVGVQILPGDSMVVPTGVSFEIPKHYYGLLTHRSSLAFKRGGILSLGIIDSNFTGEVKALVFNLSDTPLVIEKYERFCQIVFNSYYSFPLMAVGSLEGGKDGFGSSGKM